MHNDEIYYDFGRQFGAHLVGQEYERAADFVASWLRPALGGTLLQSALEGQYRGITELHHLPSGFGPGTCRVSGNISRLADLRRPSTWALPRAIPEPVTEENFRKWLMIELQPGGGDRLALEYWARLWVIVVEEAGAMKIGYLEFEC